MSPWHSASPSTHSFLSGEGEREGEREGEERERERGREEGQEGGGGREEETTLPHLQSQCN